MSDPITVPNGPVIVLPEGFNVNEIPRRPYDFNKGDRRFTTQERAIEHAETRASQTGERQVVRVDPGSLRWQALFLVQAVGS